MTRVVRRRGVLYASAGASLVRRASFRRASTWRASCAVKPGSQLAGISSHPISIRSSRSISLRDRSAGLVLCLDIRLGDADRQLPHAQDVRRSFGHPDAAARIEDVEQVRALQALLERRKNQMRVEQLLAEREVAIEELAMRLGKFGGRHPVDVSEGVLRLLDLLLQPHL